MTLERPPYRIAPPFDTLGLRHVREALRDLPFPARTRDLVARAGAWRIPTTGVQFHPLSEYLEGVPPDREFFNVDEVSDAIARAHPELRE